MGVTAVAGRRVEARTGNRPWWSASDRGPRRHQADATAGFRTRGGRLAVALADGVGDSPAAAWAARAAADHAVRVGALDGRADLAVLAARDVLLAAGRAIAGDAALTVAVGPGPATAGPTWTVAWVGDCRAWSVDGRDLHLLTQDHTVAAEMRAAGAGAGHLDHVLTTSVRTVRGATEVGLTAVPAPGTLLLASDGVHRGLHPARLAGLVAHVPTSALARTLVDTARAAGSRDNATALVVGPGSSPGPAGRPVIPGPRRP